MESRPRLLKKEDFKQVKFPQKLNTFKLIGNQNRRHYKALNSQVEYIENEGEEIRSIYLKLLYCIINCLSIIVLKKELLLRKSIHEKRDKKIIKQFSKVRLTQILGKV